jgi:peroxiredoxin Q/BCP
VNISVGRAAPLFTLATDTGDLLSLRELRGKTIILYFYPKDDTAGCTLEACEFRDLFPRFKRSGAVILGISPDSERKHGKFKEKYDLPFTLLVDEEHKVAERYGIWVEKTFYGRKYFGVERTTFIIGPDGRIQHVFAKVSPEGHAEDVRAVLASVGRGSRSGATSSRS